MPGFQDHILDVSNFQYSSGITIILHDAKGNDISIIRHIYLRFYEETVCRSFSSQRR